MMPIAMRLKFYLIALAAAGCAAFAGCVTTQVAPPVTAAMVGSAGTSEAVLKEGRRIFAGPCTSCHLADPVSTFSLPRWVEIVDDMSDRTKLDTGRKAALLAYIRAVHGG